MRERGIRVDIPLSSGGSFPGVASPMRFSETPIDYQVGPPVLGEHTEAVLCGQLGLSAEEIEGLRAARVI
ncbi:formyl-coenzyme A transferase [compost metagenome]